MNEKKTSYKKVTFKHPFTLPSIGKELPKGTYDVKVVILIMRYQGQPVPLKPDNHLIVPPNLMSEDDLGATALLMPDELEEALKADRAKTSA